MGWHARYGLNVEPSGLSRTLSARTFPRGLPLSYGRIGSFDDVPVLVHDSISRLEPFTTGMDALRLRRLEESQYREHRENGQERRAPEDHGLTSIVVQRE